MSGQRKIPIVRVVYRGRDILICMFCHDVGGGQILGKVRRTIVTRVPPEGYNGRFKPSEDLSITLPYSGT